MILKTLDIIDMLLNSLLTSLNSLLRLNFQQFKLIDHLVVFFLVALSLLGQPILEFLFLMLCHFVQLVVLLFQAA